MSYIIANELPTDTTYYRLTNEAELHNEFQYKNGLNIDTNKFDPSGSCSSGGLYFFSTEQLAMWKLYSIGSKWIRQIDFTQIPDARVYVEQGKYKADSYSFSKEASGKRMK